MTPLTKQIEQVRLAESAVVRSAVAWCERRSWETGDALEDAVKTLTEARAGLDNDGTMMRAESEGYRP